MLPNSSSYCSSLVFSYPLAPSTLSVAVSLSLTVYWSRYGCHSTFCCQHQLQKAKSASVSVFFSHCGLSHLAVFCVLWLLFLHEGTVPLYSHSRLSHYLALADCRPIATHQSTEISLSGDCPYTTFHLFSLPHSGADFNLLLKNLIVVI